MEDYSISCFSWDYMFVKLNASIVKHDSSVSSYIHTMSISNGKCVMTKVGS